MDKYQIAAAEAGEEGADEPIGHDSTLFAAPGRMATWLSMLADIVATNSNCRTFCRLRRKRVRDPRGPHWDEYIGNYRLRHTQTMIMLVGRTSDVAVASYMFAYLRREIDRLTERALAVGEIYGRTAANNYRLGAIEGIAGKLALSRAETRSEASSTALVRIDQDSALLDRYLENLQLGKGRSTPVNGDAEARAAGREAGRNISVTPGVEGAPGSKLLA